MGKPVAGVPIAASSVRARGAFVPDVTGAWQIGVANAGLARVLIDGDVVVENTEDGRGGFFFGIGAGIVARAGRAHGRPDVRSHGGAARPSGAPDGRLPPLRGPAGDQRRNGPRGRRCARC